MQITSCPTLFHNEPVSEVYLIPVGFKGKVNIIFNQPKGIAIKRENGVRVYEIPRNGILLSKDKRIDGLIKHTYYYVDSVGNRSQLKILKDTDFDNGGSTSMIETIGVFYDGTSGVYGNSDAPDPMDYQEFVVSDYNLLNSFFSTGYAKDFKEKLYGITGKRY